jgi:sugar phosphate isomerase/epimerase
MNRPISSANDGQTATRKLAVHTITTKPLGLAEAVAEYSRRGVGGISVWLDAIAGMPISEARRVISDGGLKVPALVRGGFFCDPDPEVRRQRVDQNRRLIETASELGAEMLVLVVGATPGVALDRQREWVAQGVSAMMGEAKAAGVRVAIEPLHPMYAADRSCLNRLGDARAMCEQINDPMLGVAVDVYHVWWDPDLPAELARLGAQGSIFAYHLCDWRVPTRDMLNDRALMGDGCIDLVTITRSVRAAGFDGWDEVEIFSDDHWREDQRTFLDRIVERYQSLQARVSG